MLEKWKNRNSGGKRGRNEEVGTKSWGNTKSKAIPVTGLGGL
jgi:hypothetical protein